VKGAALYSAVCDAATLYRSQSTAKCGPSLRYFVLPPQPVLLCIHLYKPRWKSNVGTDKLLSLSTWSTIVVGGWMIWPSDTTQSYCATFVFIYCTDIRPPTLCWDFGINNFRLWRQFEPIMRHYLFNFPLPCSWKFDASTYCYRSVQQ
jgi:hypothetical protein